MSYRFKSFLVNPFETVIKDKVPHLMDTNNNAVFGFAGKTFRIVTKTHLYNIHPYIVLQGDIFDDTGKYNPKDIINFICTKEECWMCKKQYIKITRGFAGVIDRSIDDIVIFDFNRDILNQLTDLHQDPNWGDHDKYDLTLNKPLFMTRNGTTISPQNKTELDDSDIEKKNDLYDDWYEEYINNFRSFEDVLKPTEQIILEFPDGSTGMRCKECRNDYQWVEPNQPDGAFVCRICRSRLE